MGNHLRVIVSIFLLTFFYSNLSQAASSPDAQNKLVAKVTYRSHWNTAETISGAYYVTDKLSKPMAAIEFLTSKKDLLKMQSPVDELEVINELTDNLGKTHIKFKQIYQNLEIFGCQTVVHFENDQMIYLVAGQTVPTPTVSTNPTITSFSASETAKKYLDDKNIPDDSKTETKLMLFPHDGTTYLVYLVDVLGNDTHIMRQKVFIDAHSGEVIHAYNNMQNEGPAIGSGPDVHGTVRSFGTYDIGGTFYMIDASFPMYTPPVENHQGVITTNMVGYPNLMNDFNNDNYWDDFFLHPEGVSSQYNLAIAFNYFYDRFGRNSYDDLGGSIHGSVHYVDPNGDVNNAFYVGDGQILFGPGEERYYLPWCGSLDVVTHELAHGVTATTAGLIYSFQSGALNEHYSDFFGAMSDPEDWLIAEDIKLTSPGFLRNMADPHQGAVPDYFEFGYQPDHMDEFVVWHEDSDNGAVHFNSGIPNKASYLTATEIGNYATEEIWYRTLTTYLTQGSNFNFWGNMTIQSAMDLYGFPSPEVTAVQNALDAVGITSVYAEQDEITMGVSIGEIADTSIVILKGYSDSLIILSASAVFGSVEISGTFPDTLTESDQGLVTFSFDATMLELCDMGVFQDTIVITTSDPSVSEIKILITINVGGETSESDRGTICRAGTCNYTYCGILFYNNTQISRFMRNDLNGLFNATLMIGIVDGVDTSIYRQFDIENGFAPTSFMRDSVNQRTGFHSIYSDIATNDSRIQGTQEYFYRYGEDYCGEFISQYKLYNVCDTPLTIVTGIYADFDPNDNGYDNFAGIIEEDNIIYTVSNNGQTAVGLAPLNGIVRNLRTINNPDVIWYDKFPFGLCYNEMMQTTNTIGSSSDDWSSILTFETTTLAPGDTVVYRAAWLYSLAGVNGLSTILHNIDMFADSALLLLDINKNFKHCLTDNIYDNDTSFIINYVVGYNGSKSFPWTATHKSNWMQLSSYSGMTDDIVSISYDLTGFEQGKYFDTIVVRCDSAVNLFQNLAIELWVNDSSGRIEVPATFLPEIQDGIDIAFEGDTIIVDNGSYPVALSVDEKAVILKSKNGPSATTLTPVANLSPVIDIYKNLNGIIDISGFTFSGTNRHATINIERSNSVFIRNNIFTKITHIGPSNKWMVNFYLSSGTAENNIFYDNNAQGIRSYFWTVSILNNTFNKNIFGVTSNTLNTTLKNNIIINSSSFGISGSFTDIDCNNIWNNTGGDYVDGATPGVNDLSANPYFCYPGALDYSIASYSVCAPENNACNILIGAAEVGNCDVLCENRGDINHSGGTIPVDISDLTQFVEYMFAGGPAPNSYEEGDIDSSGEHSISDLTFLVDFLFVNGSAPQPCSIK